MNNITVSKILQAWFHSNEFIVTREFTYRQGVQILLCKYHWVALYIHHDTVEFFDSFGRNADYFKLRFSHVVNHSKDIQHKKSKVCGYYCLGFIHALLKGSLLEFWNMFTDDRSVNDTRIVDYLHTHL